MDDTILDIDQIENLIKFCPTKEEMELLKVQMKFLIYMVFFSQKLIVYDKCNFVVFLSFFVFL